MPPKKNLSCQRQIFLWGEIVSGAAPLKTAKEPREKHRREPYFVKAEKKNFWKEVKTNS